MNSINLIGNICNDVELKQTNSGKSVVQFNLAVNRPFTKDVTDFIPVVVWNQPAEYLSRYARKGTKIAVSGKLTTRKYEDKNGNNRVAYEVVADSAEICEPRGENSASVGTNASVPTNSAPTYIPDAYKPNQGGQASFELVEQDDDLPF
ncbi:MAG: single-stranded DNA-binding protein [Ruminococcaceae bacterium]|nr:single-stranded DNA-binding protein [Oscillospiraceae bacterium]